MTRIDKVVDKINNSKFINNGVDFLKSKNVIWLNSISYFDLLSLYFKGIKSERLSDKASSISWRLFMSFIPFMYFVFTIIPYLPHFQEIQEYINDILLNKFLPESLLEKGTSFIEEQSKRSAIPGTSIWAQIFSIILYIYLSSQGIASILKGFRSYSKEYSIKSWQIPLVSLGLTVFFALLIVIGLLGIYYSEIVFRMMSDETFLTPVQNDLIGFLNLIGISILFFIGIWTLYYMGSDKPRKLRYVLPGTVMTTTLFFITIFIFRIYIGYVISQYTLLYGSLSSFFVLLIWFNMVMILILLGNELNRTLRVFIDKKHEVIKEETHHTKTFSFLE